MLLEHDRLDVGQVDDVVDNAEIRLGVFGGNLLQRGLPGEADGHDRGKAVFGELAQDLLALRLVLDLEIPKFDAGLLGEAGRAVENALVERFVELAAKVIDDGRLDLGRVGGERGEQSAANRGGEETGHAYGHCIPPGRGQRRNSARPKSSTKPSTRSTRVRLRAIRRSLARCSMSSGPGSTRATAFSRLPTAAMRLCASA